MQAAKTLRAAASRLSFPWAPLAIGLLVALAGCGGRTSPADGGPDGGSPDGGADGGEGDGGLSGLDARPSNPTCLAPARPAAVLALQPAFNNQRFRQPLFLTQAPGDPSRFFVVEKRGSVRQIAPDGSGLKDFIDISARVNSAPNEAGLLGLAIHPRWSTTKVAFLSYTAFDPAPGTPANLRSRISRFTSSDGGQTLDPASEVILIELQQPFENHNGGMLAFGPDGFLYASFGDGGSGGDPFGNAQNLNVLFGKILRLDVDAEANGKHYSIPAGNPFAAGGGSPEIWAYGLRNTWRFSFDRQTGKLWAGDVGQDLYEEIDVIEPGKNYGWNQREGFHCYRPPPEGCPASTYAEPIVEYPHNGGSASVTGGYVYRGAAIQGLNGSYLYGDEVLGTIWSIPASAAETGLKPTPTVLPFSGGSLASFGEDLDGELYVVNFGSGAIGKIVAGAGGAGGGPAALLSQTGCMSAADVTKPAPGLVPYAPAAPFWSDGAVKDRWMALPDGTSATFGEGGDLDFPNGTVLVKQFTVGGKKIETRLFFRYADGGWAGVTYQWNDAGTDAALQSAAKDLALPTQTWPLPGPAQCLACHTAAAGFSLGLEAAQLDAPLTYAATGRTANQLATLRHLGLVGAPPAVAPLPDPAGPAPLEARARAVLHTNCSQCHRPGGPAPRGDFRYATAPSQGYCDLDPTAGDLGIAGAKLLKPGAPAQSLIVARMKAQGEHRMPPLGSRVVDEQSVDLLTAWIAGLTSCP